MLYNLMIGAEPELKHLHDSKEFKYFTFSRLEVPRRRALSQGLVLLSDDAYLWVSSPDDRLVRLLGKRMLESQELSIASVNFSIAGIDLLAPLDSMGDEQFTTMSPIVLRTVREDGGTKRTWDLSPDDDEFAGNLIKNLERKYATYTGEASKGITEVTEISNCHSKRIEIDGIYHRAHMMDISMRGPPEVLKFAYDCGLGEKNSMGFGMVRLRGR
jgi:CRISPR-associated endoribonuclease Cas6